MCETIETKTRRLCHKYLRPIIIFLSPIILALNLRAYLELYTTLNYMTRPVQTVTVSSEGPAAEMYPDSMGQYNLLRDVYRYDRPVYKHVDREDRFIIFTGRIYITIQSLHIHFILLYFIEGEFWYISDDLTAEEGLIRGISEGDMFVPKQGWQFYDDSYFYVNNFDNCLTGRSDNTLLMIFYEHNLFI